MLLLLLPVSAEILRYQQHCVNKYGLAPHIRLSTRVASAAFDSASGTWAVTTARGDTVTARVLLLARGEWMGRSQRQFAHDIHLLCCTVRDNLSTRAGAGTR